MRSRKFRPITRLRASRGDRNDRVLEATAPSGAGLLIEIGVSLDGKALILRPCRADPEVYLMAKPAHENGCYLYTSRGMADGGRCDCGAMLTYDADTACWRPTERKG